MINDIYNTRVKDIITWESLVIGIGDFDFAVAVHREEEEILFISQIHDGTVIFACHPEVIFFQEEVDCVVCGNYTNVVVLDSFAFACRINVKAAASLLVLLCCILEFCFSHQTEGQLWTCLHAGYCDSELAHPLTDIQVEEAQVGRISSEERLGKEVGGFCYIFRGEELPCFGVLIFRLDIDWFF